MEKTLDDVHEQKIDFMSNNELFRILRERECCLTELSVLQDFIDRRDVINVYAGEELISFVVPKHRSMDQALEIKISENEEELLNEYIVSNLLYNYGFTTEVLDYFSSNKDYLIMEYVPKKSALEEFDSIEKMATGMASALREFHNIKIPKDSLSPEECEILVRDPHKYMDVALANEEGNSAFKDYIKQINYSTVKDYIIDNGHLFKVCDVIVHGNFSPANVFIKDGKLDKITNFSESHYGDRHFDIYYAMYTSAYYLGILDDELLLEKFNNLFLDSYGRDNIDYERLRLCGNIICMYFDQNTYKKNLTRIRF